MKNMLLQYCTDYVSPGISEGFETPSSKCFTLQEALFCTVGQFCFLNLVNLQKLSFIRYYKQLVTKGHSKMVSLQMCFLTSSSFRFCHHYSFLWLVGLQRVIPGGNIDNLGHFWTKNFKIRKKDPDNQSFRLLVKRNLHATNISK